jgi:hypothetical protein
MPMRPLDDAPPTHLRSSSIEPRPTGEQRTTAWTGDPLTTARPGSPARIVEPAISDDDEQATVARPSARRPPTGEAPPSSRRTPQICATCESPVPASFVFCRTCGARMR